MRQICETLGFNKSTLYYQPKSDPSEDILRTEIEALAAQYPKYGYRRITKLLGRMGYTVGYRRVARLMRSAKPFGFGQTYLSNHEVASGGASLEQQT